MGMQHNVPAKTDELREALGRLLAENGVAGLPIVEVERRDSAYRSSFPLEEIRLSLSDGAALDIVFKDLNRQLLSEAVRRAKPECVYDPLREIETYRRLLSQEGLGTAHFYGAVVDEAIGRFWLFVEKVAGDELWKIGEFATWEGVARWLAGMHQRFAARIALTASQSEHWLKYDAEYYRLWMRRAQEMIVRSAVPRPANDCHAFARLAGNYERVVERLAALPSTLIHGEFYASNVLIGRSGAELRVCPIDWEMAGVGPGLVDLAALVTGGWSDLERLALARAYHAALADNGEAPPPGEDRFLEALDDCRLHLAVQWLGWSDNWTPPPEHAQDWLGEALGLAEKVGCL
jgi:aminoglycoside phosphotransferase (APT) family kinase protein